MNLTGKTPRRGMALNSATIISLAVLLAAGAYLRYAKANGRLTILKEPVPLRKDLADMRKDCVSPYVVRDSIRMPDESESELGTKLYVLWSLEDPQAPKDAWWKNARLFVTYYTGNPDQVPHVPEECYEQGAFQVERSTFLKFSRPGGKEPYEVRRLRFLPPASGEPPPVVYYTFCVNGSDFYADRERVRWRLGWPSERYLYYSKIELGFHNFAEAPTAEALDKKAEEIFGHVIPVLLREHFTDMSTLESAGSTGSGATRHQ